MKTKSKLSSMLQCSLFAALLCVLSPLTIPVGAVPVSLGIFAVLLCSSVLGMRRSLVAVLVYIALGAVGLPVFAGWQGGFGVLAGPTGGYIWSYIPVCAIIGRCNDMSVGGLSLAIWAAVALCVCYVCGVLQYVAVSGASIFTALAVCVYPFVIFDTAKVWAALFVGRRIRIALIKNGFTE